MAGRPGKFKARSNTKSRGGSNLMSLLGGGDISAVEPGQVDYHDDSFNANDFSQTRFEPTNPVLNFLSGGAGSNYASNLNDATNLRNATAKIQEAKAKSLATIQHNNAIAELVKKGEIEEAQAMAKAGVDEKTANQTTDNKIFETAGVFPVGADGESNKPLLESFTRMPALQKARLEKEKIASDYKQSIGDNEIASALRPFKQKSAIAGAEFDEANSGALNQARILNDILKPKLTEAEINLKNQQAKEIFSPGGFGMVGMNKQTGEIVKSGNSVENELIKSLGGSETPQQKQDSNPSVINSIGSIVDSLKKRFSGTNPTPLPNFSRAMDYTIPKTNGIGNNMSNYFGNNTSPVNIPNNTSVTGISAAPTSTSGPYTQSAEKSSGLVADPMNPVYTRDALGNVYKNGVLQRKKTNASPAIAP